MPVDDLSAPLGAAKAKAGRRFRLALPKLPRLPRIPLLPVVATLLGAAVTGFVLWGLLVEEPLGGEPVARVAISGRGPTEPERAAGATAPAPSGHSAASTPAPTASPAPASTPAPAETPASHVNVIDGTTGKALEVSVPRMIDGMVPAPDPRVSERSRHGTIPKIASDGARPAEVYARPALIPPARAAMPRIAVVVGGLGISAGGTAEAIGKLPADITLAFAPYGTDLERVVGRARSDGHEVMLLLPMEPNDYPDSDPGPQTLLTSLTGDQNVDRMHWFFSRFTGFVGVVNYMGARFTGTEGALAPVMREIAKRGLIYLDDASSQRSIVKEVAGVVGMSFARADWAVDIVASPQEIDAALMRLERTAAERGSAIGFAGGLPVSIDRIARWAKEVEARGFQLVPLSAIAGRAKKAG